MLLKSKRDVARYMPHSGDMVWLDRVVAWDKNHIIAESDASPLFPRFANGRVPAYIGVEVMAQSIAVWYGLCRAKPTPPPLGFLLAIRRFRSACEYLPVDGAVLCARSELVVLNTDVGVFDCVLQVHDAADAKIDFATAALTVYSAPEAPANIPHR